MTGYYLRWAGILVIAIVLATLSTRNFEKNLASLTPEAIVTNSHTQANLRVQGMVKSGSLTGSPEEGHAAFELLGESKSLNVAYQGPPPDNLRELKTLILIGRWDQKARMFLAHETALVTNYGFVASAYVISFIGLFVFLLLMTRKVTLLSEEMKESKLYEPEIGTHVDQR